MRTLSSLILVVFFLSCQAKWDSKVLLGQWKTVEWMQLDSKQLLDNEMNFDFLEDGRYKVDYGSATEEGKYWISGEYLHTVEDGRAEKKVKILNLSSDSLVFEMNRAGYLERVSLIKI